MRHGLFGFPSCRGHCQHRRPSGPVRGTTANRGTETVRGVEFEWNPLTRISPLCYCSRDQRAVLPLGVPEASSASPGATARDHAESAAVLVSGGSGVSTVLDPEVAEA